VNTSNQGKGAVVLKQADFLNSLEQLRFTGRFVQTDSTGQTWILYFSHGQIVYATGGVHPIRRWRRNLLTYCPRIPTYRLAWQSDLAKIQPDKNQVNWEYSLLNLWVTQQRITQKQAEQVIQATVTEVLFDMLQAATVTEKLQYSESFSYCFSPIAVETALSQAEAAYQVWQVRLQAYSPNHAPVIRQPEQLRQRSSEQLYQTLSTLLNGQRTLRDLAVEMRRDVVEIASSLLQFVQLGVIEMALIADLPGLLFRRDPPELPAVSAPQSQPLIACVDDSIMVRNMMEKLLTPSGYRFLGVDDPLRAIGILLSRKPDFIFLDLVMPNVNGYEVCEKLRKISCFRHTPIVILTGSDGYANRLRSNFVGASDFLSKPLNAEAVLGVINKHLHQTTSLSPTLK
jgi:chemotaxis family two-component system response regulator PixG